MMEIENLSEEQLKMLLSTPHQIYLIDDTLKINVTPFKSEVTFGNINPAGFPQTAVSINLSTNDLYRICNKIISAIKKDSTTITEIQKSFIKEIS